MANPEKIKNYSADGAVGQFLIVKPGGAAGQVKVAAAATDKLLGVSTFVEADDGEPCDIVHSGIADAICGDAVDAGDLLTSDGAGRAVKAAPAPSINNRLIATALADGTAGDIIPVLIRVGSIQG
jgi:hypothetical protein